MGTSENYPAINMKCIVYKKGGSECILDRRNRAYNGHEVRERSFSKKRKKFSLIGIHVIIERT